MWKNRIIGVLTLGGAFAGIVVILSQISLSTLGVSGVVIVLVFVTLFAVGIPAGVLTLEKSPNAYYWLYPYWLLQVVAISSPVIIYKFLSGAAFYIGFEQANLKFNFFYGSLFNFYIGTEAPVGIQFNLVAIFVLIYIRKMKENDT